MISMRSRHADGQGLVELALVLPVFILVVVGIADLGRAVFAYNTIANAARESARVAIVNQTPADVEGEALQQSVSLDLVASDVAITYTAAGGSGSCGTPVEVGCLASVTVEYQFVAATPVLGQIVGPFTLTATTQMPVERTCPNPADPSLVTCPWP